MKILVDADSCPVKSMIVKLAKSYRVEVLMFFDTSHHYEDGYSKVFILDKGRDSVDFALIERARKNDIVITQDYGVASMALTRGARVIHPNGFLFTPETIDFYLQNRYLSYKQYKRTGHRKGPRKRTKADDEAFARLFEQQIILGKEEIFHE